VSTQLQLSNNNNNNGSVGKLSAIAIHMLPLCWQSKKKNMNGKVMTLPLACRFNYYSCIVQSAVKKSLQQLNYQMS
jgi:hypothetical protein